MGWYHAGQSAWWVLYLLGCRAGFPLMFRVSGFWIGVTSGLRSDETMPKNSLVIRTTKKIAFGVALLHAGCRSHYIKTSSTSSRYSGQAKIEAV